MLVTVSNQQHLLNAVCHPFNGISSQSTRAFSRTSLCRAADSSASGSEGKKGGFWSSLTGRSAASKFGSGKSGKNHQEKSRGGPTKDSGRSGSSSKHQEHQNQKQRLDKSNKSHGGRHMVDQQSQQQLKLQNKPHQQNKPSQSSSRQAPRESQNKARRNNMELRSGKSKTSLSGQQSHTGDHATKRNSDSQQSTPQFDRRFKSASPAKSLGAGRVKHDKNGHKFILDLGDGQVARIDYRLMESDGHKTIEMYHTEVPEELRGRGIGKALARGALEQARKANMRCKLTCSYLVDYLNRFASDDERKSVIDC